jgi:tetratricopeptide (TPR) repeat protein
VSVWDRLKEAVGVKPTTGDVALEGERLVLKALDRARKIPQEASQPGRRSMTSCETCGGSLHQVAITTAGVGEQLAVWKAYPLAVDGWLCKRCGSLVAPRYISPEESAEYGRQGAAHAKSGNLDDAEFWFRRILGSWPGYWAGYADLGQVYLARADAATDPYEGLRHRQQATALFRKAVELHKGPVGKVRLPFARALGLSGNETEALEQLQAMIGEPAIDEALRSEARAIMEGIHEGRALFTRASELLKGVVLEPPHKRLSPEARKRLEEGRALLRSAVARKATFPSTWFLGKAELRLGNYEAAAEAFERACAVNPEQPDGQRELCSAYLELARTKDALRAAKRAVELRPDDPTLRCNLAVALLLAGDLEGARREVRTSTARDPNDPITRSVAEVIDEIAAGRRKQPRTLAELENRS